MPNGWIWKKLAFASFVWCCCQINGTMSFSSIQSPSIQSPENFQCVIKGHVQVQVMNCNQFMGARMLICQLVSRQWRKPTFMFPSFFLALFLSQFPFLWASLKMKDNVPLSIRSTEKKGNNNPLFKRKVHKKDASDLCNHLFLDTQVICKSPTWQTSL